MMNTAAAVEFERRLVEYTDSNDGVLLEGFLCVPKVAVGGKMPAVLVCHAFAGITEFEMEQCQGLARLGFVAFAADVYGKDNRSQKVDECFAILKRYTEDRTKLLRGRLLTALERLRTFDFVDPEKIAVIGFCFGGRCALDLARINAPGVVAAVSFHGTLLPLPDQPKPENEPKMEASVLICHGDADIHIKPSQCIGVMEELRARKADWQFISYANAMHSFTEPKPKLANHEGVGYDAKAAKRSWAAMLDLLNEKFS